MAEVIKINSNNLDSAVIRLAANVIRKGGLVIYPTETVYGLGANALDAKAVRKVIAVKGRDPKKPITVAFENLEHAKRYAKFSPLALKLAKEFLPGPLTLVLPQKRKIPKELNPDNKIRVRIIEHSVVKALLEKSKVPITSTSANLSGGKNPITASEAVKQIGDKIDLVLDSGKCKYSGPSTVVEIVNNKIKILREGVISKEQIKLF